MSTLSELDENREHVDSPPGGPRPDTTGTTEVGRHASLVPLAAALVVCATVWVAMFVMRVHAHQPNVDDYLYAGIAYHLAQHSFLGIFTSALHSGSTSPLVPTLAALLTGGNSVNSIVSLQVLFLMALVVGAYLLARVWLGPVPAAIAATTACLTPAILGYSVMTNFAVPVTAAVVWSLACYLRSDRLRRWSWSVGFGAAVAATLLSRSLAPGYVAPLVVLVVIDVLVDLFRHRRGDRPRPVGPLLAAIAVTLLVAGPWWLVSGRTALHYLTNAGYDTSSGFSRGSGLSWSLASNRLAATLEDLDSWQADVLKVAIGLAIVAVALRWRDALRSRAWLPVAWCLLTFALLSTSANDGTGFGIPVLTVVIVMTAVALMARPRLPRPLLAVVAVLIGATVTVGVVAEFAGGFNRGWQGPQYRQEVLVAGGSRSTNVEQINDQVSQALGTTPAVLAREDPVLNANGLRWAKRNLPARGVQIFVPPFDTSATRSAISALKRAGALVTGSSEVTFQGNLDTHAVQSAALREGFRAVKQWTVGPSNQIVLMERPGPGRLPALTNLPPGSTRVLQPTNGSEVSATRYLVAGARGPVGIASLSFVISGPELAHPLRLRTGAFPYGWIGLWKTTAVPNGSYTLRSVAVGLDGRSVSSAPVEVTVAN